MDREEELAALRAQVDALRVQLRQAELRQRQSEEQLQEAETLALLGNWFWDVATGDVQWSPEVYKIFRLSPETFTPKIDSILALTPWPEERARDQELISRAIESRETGSYEQRFLRPDGSSGYYHSTFKGLYDERGALKAIRGIVQDITAQKEAELERIRLEGQLHNAQKMEAIGRLAGGIAHDFNNMLCAILGNAELALESVSEENPLREPFAEIVDAAERAAQLTQQLLAFSRKQVIQPRVLDLSELVGSLRPMLARLIGEDIILDCALQPRLGVRMDPGQLEQVVLNLALNARDAMPNGGELLLETSGVLLDDHYPATHARGASGPHVLLAVSDTGCGMSAEVQKKVFEPFFTTKEMGQGTGLGLATVFGVVAQSNGWIDVYSEPGQGTTFKIYFPRIYEDAVPAREAPVSVRGGRETVLVVEDEPKVRGLAVRLLERLGYTVLAAASGDEALSLAEETARIDLLLTDVVMPHMNGRQLAERLARRQPGLKVLFASGYTQNVIAHHGVLDHGVQFLPKPYSLTSLATRVREVLDAPKAT